MYKVFQLVLQCNSVSADIGIIGLGVMGQNLALNLLDHRFSLAAYSYADHERADFSKNQNDNLVIPDSLDEFVASLAAPRKILLMVTAGEPVDQVITDLTPHLSVGDVIIDGGNSHYSDTRRREAALRANQLNFIGTGISGGEAGARNGASIMPGGDKNAFEITAPIFEALSISIDGEPCYAHLGTDGAGHFVKMVHNGIEYGVMQLIAEAAQLLKSSQSHEEIAETFHTWNQGRLKSYLVEITSAIFRQADDLGEGFLIDQVADAAGQKGTGRWTVDAGMELGIPIPTIIAAVTERQISGHTQTRAAFGAIENQEAAAAPQDLESALYAAVLLTYAQGLHLIQHASDIYEWETPLTDVLKLWRGGCIIRAAMLDDMIKWLDSSDSLLISTAFRDAVQSNRQSLQDAVTISVQAGLPSPAMSASLNYLLSLLTEDLPTQLVQAQRDYFGAHTYQRKDREGTFHTNWAPYET